MESKTVFDGNKFTVTFGKADAEQLEEGFLTSTLWSALSVLMLSATGHFDFGKYIKVMDYLLEDGCHEKANW